MKTLRALQTICKLFANYLISFSGVLACARRPDLRRPRLRRPRLRRPRLRRPDLHRPRLRPIQALTDAMRDMGISKQHCVLEHMPDGEMDNDASADVAHLFLLGVTRHELFWMLDDLISSGVFSWDDLNAEVAKMNGTLPKEHKLPPLEKPTTEGKAKASVNMNLSAAEVMHVAMNRCAPLLLHMPALRTQAARLRLALVTARLLVAASL